jgi:hypothetical protein
VPCSETAGFAELTLDEVSKIVGTASLLFAQAKQLKPAGVDRGLNRIA